MRYFRNHKWMAALIALALVVLLAGPASAAYVVKQSWIRISGTAGETLTTGQAVCFKDADGYVYKADANDGDLRPAIGVVGSKGASSGGAVEIVVVGVLSGWSTLSEGAPCYLSETAGGITQSAPAWSQQLGVAVSTTAYFINCQNYFDSSSLAVLGTLTGASPLVLEGATANDHETTIAVTDPTADRTITLPDASGVPILSAAVPEGATAVSGAANSLIFEGATANDFETTVTATDPTADRTVTLPDGGGTVMLSSLATNAVDAANAVTGASNGLVFEGATANDFETTVTPTDPTADRTITLPDASGVPILSAAVPEGATAVSGAANSLIFEGATANDFETTVTATDPTADRTVTLPDGGGTVMLSSLATNAVDAANAVTGASNGLVFEGATANDFETTVTPTDPTADRTVTLPDASGTVDVLGSASHDYGAAAVDWTMTAAEGNATYITATNANGAVNAILASAVTGKIYIVYNATGQVLTFKVTGQAGGTIANTKYAIYICNGTDVVEIFEQP